MKPLTLDQQIQVARVLGWISGVIEGSALPRVQHEAIRHAAAHLCPILNLPSTDRTIDNLWELAGLPEGGLEGEKDSAWFYGLLGELAAPLRRKP